MIHLAQLVDFSLDYYLVCMLIYMTIINIKYMVFFIFLENIAEVEPDACELGHF